jgi:predicted Rossmann fold nucleotide-binding protein DprA/Smf involved in DNA uptake
MTEYFVLGRPKPTPRQVAVVGSREYARLDLVREFVLRLPEGSTVISGGARGVDQTAVNVARARGLETIVFQADWQKHSCRAGPMRNVEIVAHAKDVVAFWDDSSRGTLNTIVLAHRAGLPIVMLNGQGDLFPVKAALRAAQERGIVATIERAQPAGLLEPPTDREAKPDPQVLERDT